MKDFLMVCLIVSSTIFVIYYFNLLPNSVIRFFSPKLKPKILIAYNSTSKTKIIYCNGAFVGHFTNGNQLIPEDNIDTIEKFLQRLAVETRSELEEVNSKLF